MEVEGVAMADMEVEGVAMAAMAMAMDTEAEVITRVVEGVEVLVLKVPLVLQVLLSLATLAHGLHALQRVTIL